MSGLPERLQAAMELVPECGCFLDIGTDHGYLPIELIRSKRAHRAIAADIGMGPLSRAKEHIRAAGLENLVETRLSDGLLAIAPGEADTAGILGMGGGTIRKILMEGNPREKGIETLVLGPQSEVPEVRSFLLKNGYAIREERLVFEDGKYYFLMLVLVTPKERKNPYSEEELLFGRSLLAKRDETLKGYLLWREEVLKKIQENLKRASSAGQREEAVRKELELIKKVLGTMY